MDDHQISLEQERQWVAAAKQDIARFRPLYEKYADAVYRFFVRRTDQPALAEELTSTTFFKALDNLAEYEWQGAPFGAWLFRIATNELRRHFRDKKPIYVLELDKFDCLAEEEEVIVDHLPAVILELDALDDFDLRLLELRFFEGMSFVQISELLEIGESAAKMRLYRLLDKMRRKLEGMS